MNLGERLEKNQVPRRLLGVVLSVLVPGAGHIVLGYHKVGWILAAAMFSIGSAFLLAVVNCSMTWVAIFGGLVVLSMIGGALSVLALPPGPKLKDGLRALWPVLVLFLISRGYAHLVESRVLAVDGMPDKTMEPRIVRGDVIFSQVGVPDPHEGDLVFVEYPPASDKHYLRRVLAVDGDSIRLYTDVADPEAEKIPTVTRSQLRSRPLFVFAAARGTNGIDRVWKPLQGRR